MITEADIEKIIYRCIENYWNTRDSKINNLRRVPKIAANDVWKVLMQELPQPHQDHIVDSDKMLKRSGLSDREIVKEFFEKAIDILDENLPSQTRDNT